MLVGVLLAAGAGTRMGGPKALARSRGQSFLVHGVRALWTVCDTVVVVVGSEAERVCKAAGEEFEALVAKGMLAPDPRLGPGDRTGELEVRFVTNARWRDGMLGSARVGLAAAVKARPRGVLVLPVDHPEVKPATVRALGAVLEEAMRASAGKPAGPFAYALVPRFRGHRGHPVALSAALAGAIARDGSARDLADGIRRSARLVGYLDVADKGVTVNRNTPEAGAKRKPARKRAPAQTAKRAKR